MKKVAENDLTVERTATCTSTLSTKQSDARTDAFLDVFSNELERKSHKICLISSGMIEKNIRLQPWRYLHETAQQLIQQGHHVTVLSDGNNAENRSKDFDEDIVAGLPIQRLPSVGRSRIYFPRLIGGRRGSNKALTKAIETINPDIILWHVGITSFLHQQIGGWPDVPVIGVLTSPMYELADLWRMGVRKIIKNRDLSAMHVAGTLLPRKIITSVLNSGKLEKVVVQTQTMHKQLLALGVHQSRIAVIAPGVDKEWFRTVPDSASGSASGSEPDSSHALRCPKIDESRKTLGYGFADKVILYYGSPAPLRGLHTLIRATEIAHEQDKSIRLLVLSRRHADQLMSEDEELRALLSRSDIQAYTQIVDGFLEPETLVEFVATADIVALPFELVPSDAPLSLLESKALGKPIVTTNLACLPELAAGGTHYIAEPSDAVSLAQALLQAVADLPASRTEDERSHTGSQQLASSAVTEHKTPLRRWGKVGEEWSHLIQTL